MVPRALKSTRLMVTKLVIRPDDWACPADSKLGQVGDDRVSGRHFRTVVVCLYLSRRASQPGGKR